MNETEQCRLCTNLTDQIKSEKLFERNQRKLLQHIEELIGQKLKNAKELPQHICKICEEQLLLAHAFRTQCIQAQKLFATQIRKSNKPKKRKIKEEVNVEVSIEEVILNEINPAQIENLELDNVTIQLSPQQVGEEEVAIDEVVLNELNPVQIENSVLEDGTNQLLQPEPVGEEGEVSIERVLNELNPVKVEKFEREHGSTIQLPSEINGGEALLILEQTTFDNDFKEAINEDDFYDSLNPLDEDLYVTGEADMPIEPEAAKQSLPLETELKKPRKKKKYTYVKKVKNKKDKCGARRDEPPYICDQCGRIFKGRSLLESHLRRHAGDKKFKCEICTDSFFLNAELKRHLRKHSGEMPYPCSHCERRFRDKGTASKHERIHTNERRYVCQQCGKGFNVAHTLSNHMLSHTNERAFSCKICNMTFKRKTHLVTHYRSLTHKQNEEKFQMNIST